MIKHLVTSGCSFSDNLGIRWPHALANQLNLNLYNRGQGSCGNDWISRSVIYQTQKLLNEGILPNEILVSVMWSGIDRKSLFISKNETVNYDSLLNHDGPWDCNPVNYIDNEFNSPCTGPRIDGYLAGAMTCKFNNNNINKFKQECINKFYPDESLAIESYEHFLRLQWFCESKGIALINQTFMDIMHYPKYSENKNYPLTRDYYRNVSFLYDMIDFKKWIFYKNTQGIYEYTRDNKLQFYKDGVHPLPESHEIYTRDFLIPELKKRVIL